jgi:hypothetical protein
MSRASADVLFHERADEAHLRYERTMKPAREKLFEAKKAWLAAQREYHALCDLARHNEQEEVKAALDARSANRVKARNG